MLETQVLLSMKALFAKILIGTQGISVVVTRDFKIDFSGERALAIANENIYLFCV